MLVAALGVESLPLLRRLAGPRILTPRLVVGRMGRAEVGVLTAGVGPTRAERRTRQALEAWKPDRLVSVGTCGALVDRLSIGDVLVGGDLLVEDAPVATLAPLPGRVVCVTTVPRPVHQAGQRARLAAAGAEVCEMEAAAVWRAAGEIPVSAVKIVSDHAGATDDPAIGPGGLPDAARIARFKARALSLSERGLAPALLDLLETP